MQQSATPRVWSLHLIGEIFSLGGFGERPVIEDTLEEGDALLPPAHTSMPRVNSPLDFWIPKEKCLCIYRVYFIDNGFLYRVDDGKDLQCVN